MTLSNEKPAKPGSATANSAAVLREFAMTFPEAWEDFPWGHSAFKVGKKVFLFLAASEAGLSLSVKLPDSNFEALLLPFATPTGYGLGKSGWVSASFEPPAKPPIVTLTEWIEESYRAVALKGLVKQLDGETRQAPKKKSSVKKTAPKKAKKKKIVAKKSAEKRTKKKSTRKKATSRKVAKKTSKATSSTKSTTRKRAAKKKRSSKG